MTTKKKGIDMKNFDALTRGFAVALCLMASAAIAQDSGNWDGLVEVKGKRLDAVFLLPGADFRAYKKVMMDPVEVAFVKNWARDYNRDAAARSGGYQSYERRTSSSSRSMNRGGGGARPRRR